MASEWYLINKPTYNSGFEGEEFNAYKNDGLEEMLGEDSPISSSVSLINSDSSEILNFRAVVQNNTSDNKTNTTDRQVITYIGTLKCGDYILYDGNVYMVISFVGNNKIYEKAIVELCNYTLKFQSTDGTILSYPCVTDNRVQGTGDTDTKVMTLPAGRKIILLPHDENTTLLRNDRRLFVDLHPTDPRPYEIDFVDSTKFNYGDKGLLEVYVTEGALNLSTDRVDLGICNYFEPTIEPEPPNPEVPTEIVTITSDDAIDNEIMLGLPHLFSSTFKNELGEYVDNVIAEYSVDNTYDGKVVLTDNGDGTCTVQVGDFDDTELCTKQFTLSCMDIRHGFSSSVLLTIIGLF